tara:strand:- start:43 stop:291 length:249 start_codon:yes stop_codon:yes gene_type:complete
MGIIFTCIDKDDDILYLKPIKDRFRSESIPFKSSPIEIPTDKKRSKSEPTRTKSDSQIIKINRKTESEPPIHIYFMGEQITI